MSESKVVYILTNPAMPGLAKIGKTKNLEKRVKDLSRPSGLPVPYEVHYACELVPNLDPDRVEKGLHYAFGDHRVNSKREFFEIDPERVVAILKTMALNDVTPNSDNYVEDQEEKKSLDKEKKRRASFTFPSVGIPEGSIIYFALNTDITAKVVGDRKVECEGEVTKLSPAAGKVLMRDHGWTHSAVQGPAFWRYENETLAARRLRLESEESKNVLGRVKKKSPTPSFKFSLADIPIGSVIHFVKKTNITAVVVDDKNKVRFEGKVLSLSNAALKVLARKGSKATSCRGPAHWVYENELLSDRRERLENKQKHML